MRASTCFVNIIQLTARQAAVLPYHFNRSITSLAADYDFRNTTVSNAPSFNLLLNTSFVVFDRERGLKYLGSDPTYEFVFAVGDNMKLLFMFLV